MSGRARSARVVRKTKETRIDLRLELDGNARSNQIQTPLPFLNHMLTLFAAHGGFGLTLKAKGDVEVDDHHLVEDIGICLGQALTKALGDKKGIRRYGDAVVPMDESLVQVAIDISGRAYLAYALAPSAKAIKNFEVGLVKELFLGFVRNVPCTMHINQQTRGGSAHHQIEAAFKSFGQALGMAVERRGRFRGVPSTKGLL